MLYTEAPCRIVSPGTFPFAPGVQAVYTVGRDFVGPALAKLFERTRDVSCDIETYGLGLDGRRLKSVAFSDDAFVVILDPRDERQAELIRKAFEFCHSVAFWGGTFDVPNLYLNDLIRLVDVKKVVDPLLWARMAHPSERGGNRLEEAGERWLGTAPGGALERAFKAMGFTKTKGYERFDLDRPIYLQGAAADPLMTHRLKSIVRQAAYDQLTQGHPFGPKGVTGDEAWTLVDREQRINRITLARTCRGYRVDFDFLDRYRTENALKVAEAEEALAAAGVRPENGQDLAKVLGDEIKEDHPRTAPTKRFPDGQLQMTQKVVEGINHPLAKLFIQHKKIVKVDRDYLQKCVDLSIDGKIHPITKILAAITGRAAMGDPPIHQFPGSARGIVLADEGDDWTSLDLSQGEPATIMNMARDTESVAGYESGITDIYTQLGVSAGMLPFGTVTSDCEIWANPGLYKIRKVLKIVVLAQMYGEGLFKLSNDLGLDHGPYEAVDAYEAGWRGVAEGTMVARFAAAKALRDTILGAMPKTASFMLKLKAIAKEYRKCITVSGRVIPIPMGKYGVEAHKGINYPCQGGQYDLIADAICRMDDEGLGDALHITMHDELVVSTSAAHDVRRILETPAERLSFWAGRTPILRTDEAHLGERWAAA